MKDDTDLKRVRWRCRRGMRELDQLMTGWLDMHWAVASDDERGVFLRLVDCEDDRLWKWFTGMERPDDAALDSLVQQVRSRPQQR